MKIKNSQSEIAIITAANIVSSLIWYSGPEQVFNSLYGIKLCHTQQCGFDSIRRALASWCLDFVLQKLLSLPKYLQNRLKILFLIFFLLSHQQIPGLFASEFLLYRNPKSKNSFFSLPKSGKP